MEGVIIFLLFVLALLGLVLYLVFLVARRMARWRPPYGPMIVGVLALFAVWFVFRAFHPSESFYRAEFEREAGFELPAAARFIAGNTSFPDHFGDYCTAAVFELKPEDWKALPQKLYAPTGDAARSWGSSCTNAVGEYISGPLDSKTATVEEGGVYFSWGKHEPSRRVVFHYSSW